MRARQNTVRVFIALDLPPAAKDSLAETVARLKAVIPTGVRWVDPSGIHLTLKFLGDIDIALAEPALDKLRESANQFSGGPLPLHIAGLGVFPNPREPRVLWAGVGGDLAALGRWQQRVDESCSTLGFPGERQPFRPHLTLGRVQGRVAAAARRQIGTAIAEAPPLPGYSWQSDAIHLIRSDRTTQGAIYTSLGSASLT